MEYVSTTARRVDDCSREKIMETEVKSKKKNKKNKLRPVTESGKMSEELRPRTSILRSNNWS